MNSELIKKIIAEWLKDKVFPPLIKRDMPELVLEKASEIIAIAGPRRAGKTSYMYQLIQELLAQGNWSRDDILFVDFEDYCFVDFIVTDTDALLPLFSRLPEKRRLFFFSMKFSSCPVGAASCGHCTIRTATVSL